MSSSLKLKLKLRSKSKTLSYKRHPMAIIRESICPTVIDISSGKTGSSSGELNLSLITVFSQLINYIKMKQEITTDSEKRKNTYRIRQFSNVLREIKDFDSEITSGSDLLHIKGIGKGTADRIDEILETGTLTELGVVPVVVIDPTATIINELKTLHGIGDSIAKRLIKKYNVKGVDDLVDKYHSGEIEIGKNQISEHIAVGLDYHKEIGQKIPFSHIRKADKFLQKFIKKIDPKLELIICGSHRRQMPLSGDIDILITHPDIKTKKDIVKSKKKYLIDLVNSLTERKFLIAHLTKKGDTKYMGICHIPKCEKIGRRIDIRFVAYEAYHPCILYFTGCGEFNVKMRSIANNRGFTLNEYGLFQYVDGIKGDMITGIRSERDIFDIIGIKYIDPIKRSYL